MKKIKPLTFLIALFIISNLCFGQSQTTEQKDKPLLAVEQMPEFPGGETALYQFLSKNIRYPNAARENGIEGKVILQFVVNEDGSISDIKTLRDLGGGCTDESIRVLKMMPKWKPGMQNGKIVRVQFVLPIAFKLSSDDEKNVSIVQPVFPGGENALNKFLSKKIKYPREARKRKIEGRVVLQFVVKTDGSISDIKALNTVAGGCTEEAIKVVKKMPKWVPGKENGVVADEKMVLPMDFKLK